MLSLNGLLWRAAVEARPNYALRFQRLSPAVAGSAGTSLALSSRCVAISLSRILGAAPHGLAGFVRHRRTLHGRRTREKAVPPARKHSGGEFWLSYDSDEVKARSCIRNRVRQRCRSAVSLGDQTRSAEAVVGLVKRAATKYRTASRFAAKRSRRRCEKAHRKNAGISATSRQPAGALHAGRRFDQRVSCEESEGSL